MSNPVSVSRLEVKSHDSPDEVRTPNKTRVEVVRLEGFTLGRIVLEPGWRWSECVKPVVKTESCQVSHVGYCVSGSFVVKTEGRHREDHLRRRVVHHPAGPRRLERDQRKGRGARSAERRRIRQAGLGRGRPPHANGARADAR